MVQKNCKKQAKNTLKLHLLKGVIWLAEIWHNQKINTTTGEVLTSYTKTAFSRFNEQGYLFFANKNYSRVFADIDIPDCFTDLEVGRIYRLKRYIQKNSNMLRIRTNSGYRPMNRNDIYKLCNLKERQGKAFISKMIRHGILADVTILCEGIKTKQLYINPLYFHNGKRINATLYNIFKLQLDKYLDKWVKEEFKQLLEKE